MEVIRPQPFNTGKDPVVIEAQELFNQWERDYDSKKIYEALEDKKVTIQDLYATFRKKKLDEIFKDLQNPETYMMWFVNTDTWEPNIEAKEEYLKKVFSWREVLDEEIKKKRKHDIRRHCEINGPEQLGIEPRTKAAYEELIKQIDSIEWDSDWPHYVNNFVEQFVKDHTEIPTNEQLHLEENRAFWTSQFDIFIKASPPGPEQDWVLAKKAEWAAKTKYPPKQAKDRIISNVMLEMQEWQRSQAAKEPQKKAIAEKPASEPTPDTNVAPEPNNAAGSLPSEGMEERKGYVKIPHCIMMILAKTKFSNYARRILDSVLDRTLGYQKTKYRISYKVLASDTGLKQNYIARGLKELEKKGWIKKHRYEVELLIKC